MLYQEYNTKEYPFKHPYGYSNNFEDESNQIFLSALLRKADPSSKNARIMMNNSTKKMQVMNSTSQDGMQRTLDTLTQISKEVFRSKYYTIDFSDLVPISTEGAYLENMFNYSIVGETPEFEKGFFKLSDTIREITSDLTIDSKTIPFGAYNRKVSYNIFQQKQGEIINFSILQEKMALEKKINDLGIQKLIFLGQANGLNSFPGLLTNPSYTIDTTTLTTFLYNLSDPDFISFVNSLVLKYYKYTNYTTLPNRWIVPVEELKTIGMPFSQQYPLKSRLQYMTEVFRMSLSSIGNPKKIIEEGKEVVDFKIIATPYASIPDMSTRGINANTYLLYNFSNDVADCGLKVHIPLDFVNFGTYTADGLNFHSTYITQMSGVNIYRPLQFYCMQHTATS
jgi:hypothetical protein